MDFLERFGFWQYMSDIPTLRSVVWGIVGVFLCVCAVMVSILML